MIDEKRTAAITVRLTESDLKNLRHAADILWPGAVLTQSGIVLGLARLKADEVLKRKPVREK
jgi:hypothetical protein